MRIFISLLVLGLAAGISVLAYFEVPAQRFFSPSFSSQPIELAAWSEQLFCPGGITVPNDASVSLESDFNPMPTPPLSETVALATGGVESALISNFEETDFLPLTGDPLKQLRIDDGVPRILNSTFQNNQTGTDALAISVSEVSQGDLRGLAGQTCALAAFDFWFWGGGTQIGENLQLNITNQTEANASIVVELYNLDSSNEALAIEHFNVPQHDTTKLLVSQIKLGLENVIVHLKSNDTPVTVLAQYNQLHELTSQGVEYLPSLNFATEHYFPLLTVSNEQHQTLKTWSNSPMNATLNLFNTSDPITPITLEPNSQTPNGTIWDLNTLPTGNYWAKVNSDVQFIAQLQTNFVPSQTDNEQSSPNSASKTKKQTNSETESTNTTANQSPLSLTTELVEFNFNATAHPMNYGTLILPSKLAATTVLVNPNPEPMTVAVTQFGLQGEMLSLDSITLPAGGIHFIPKTKDQNLGYIVVQSQDLEQQFMGGTTIHSENGITSYNFSRSELKSQTVQLKQVR
ncbi:MAG: DUF5719 family protein [Bifidobacteriaceae bacterium]|jgi:hypothetical protein|nr:DUF5719 family protein [Bifidobacteriaceae bacterium]